MRASHEELLRAGIADGADEDAGRRAVDGLLAFAMELLRDAEVGEHRLAGRALDENVLRLDVAVNDVLAVRHIERRGDLPANAEDFEVGQRPVRDQDLAQAAALDEIHHDVGAAFFLLDVMHLDDMGMLELRHADRFLEEAIEKVLAAGELGVQHFDRAPPIREALVGHLVDGAHAALPDLADDLVLARFEFRRLRHCRWLSPR
jgi:hypothetical protein